MKGIILAGGAGSRLHPLTKVTSKQLLPIYDKPMIYYPLQTLVDGGIKDILIISDPVNIGNFVRLLGSGKEFGVKLTYEVQDKPGGLAQAFLIAEDFMDDQNITMILGDNLFVGDNSFLKDAIRSFDAGGRVFAHKVSDPSRFGVVEFDDKNKAKGIEEKPAKPKSDFAVTGLYIYDNTVVQKAKSLKPSERGEIEITDLNNLYLKENNLDVKIYEGYWLDTGTFDSLYEATKKIYELRNKN
ncbi:NTP transferase domain-containing protein [Candidatus Parcubacteria bacterium]|jgi:glucose-1-phosphate thymidylyltransferase|nr:NTP transferase domain-containing protein [Candidatus Parcubacteria bacterium]MBT7228713.1 NTP transferase domain-containing protein [Candidatus Parcubacteria bacterium]